MKRATNLTAAVHLHTSEQMTELPDDCVTLTVTSPPYWNAIDYDRHAADKSQYYRTRAYSNGFSKYHEYLEWLVRIFREVRRVTKPGGFCAIVIGTVLLEREHYPVPLQLTDVLMKDGWLFHQDFIWHKCTAGVKRAGSAIQHPYPGYFYPNIMTEYILLFRKPGPRIYDGLDSAAKAEAAYAIDRVFTMDVANNVWHVAPVPPDLIDHPCPFPEEIPYRMVQLYSYPGDLVLDPFAGSGQTLKVAHHLGRSVVGYEIVQKYADLSVSRLNEPLKVRPQQLVARFDKVDLGTAIGGHASARSPRRGPRRPNLATDEHPPRLF